MSVIGSFALMLALVLSAYSFVAGFFALFGKDAASARLGETARRAGIATFAAVLLAGIVLVMAAFSDDFSLAYIFHHSNRELPAAYKFAVLWSGQEGSLLFWSLLLAGYGFVLRLRYKTDQQLFAHASVVIAAVQVFFLLILNFAAHPFGVIQGPLPQDGTGLNPLLQYPEMVIHPPMLYLGYVGFTVPFAFALGALIMKYPGEKWIHITRRWTMVTWCFLTIGVFLGAHWAYAVLGWGGYWGWDPVENASLMPWLTGTAFLHSVIMQEKRGMMRVWNVWLVFLTFMLCILGTSLTRSGAVNSVHAFAESQIGHWFWGFLLLILVVCVAAYFKNRDYLRSDNQLDSMLSRESSFLFNNLILLVACVAVLAGTLFPVLSEAVRGSKISVGPPFFNLVNIPIAMFLLFLTGVGPLLAWRKTSVESLKKNFGIPLMSGVVAAIIAVALGLREFYVTLCVMLSVFVTLTILSEFYRGARVISARSGSNLFSSVSQLTMRNTRRYGGGAVPFGMVLVFIGISGQAFNQDKQMDMSAGSEMNIGPYNLHLQNYDTTQEPNYSAERATIDVEKGGRSVMMLYPTRRFYPSNQESGTMVAISSTLREDLYVVYAGTNPDTNLPVIHAYLNPLVKWIWLGGAVVVLGTILALLPNRQAVMVLSSATAEVSAPMPGGAQPAQVSYSARSQLPDRHD